MTRRQKEMIKIIGRILKQNLWKLEITTDEDIFTKNDITISFTQDDVRIYDYYEVIGLCNYGLGFYDKFWDMYNNIVGDKE